MQTPRGPSTNERRRRSRHRPAPRRRGFRGRFPSDGAASPQRLSGDPVRARRLARDAGGGPRRRRLARGPVGLLDARAVVPRGARARPRTCARPPGDPVVGQRRRGGSRRAAEARRLRFRRQGPSRAAAARDPEQPARSRRTAGVAGRGGRAARQRGTQPAGARRGPARRVAVRSVDRPCRDRRPLSRASPDRCPGLLHCRADRTRPPRRPRAVRRFPRDAARSGGSVGAIRDRRPPPAPGRQRPLVRDHGPRVLRGRGVGPPSALRDRHVPGHHGASRCRGRPARARRTPGPARKRRAHGPRRDPFVPPPPGRSPERPVREQRAGSRVSTAPRRTRRGRRSAVRARASGRSRCAARGHRGIRARHDAVAGRVPDPSRRRHRALARGPFGAAARTRRRRAVARLHPGRHRAQDGRGRARRGAARPRAGAGDGPRRQLELRAARHDDHRVARARAVLWRRGWRRRCRDVVDAHPSGRSSGRAVGVAPRAEGGAVRRRAPHRGGGSREVGPREGRGRLRAGRPRGLGARHHAGHHRGARGAGCARHVSPAPRTGSRRADRRSARAGELPLRAHRQRAVPGVVQGHRQPLPRREPCERRRVRPRHRGDGRPHRRRAVARPGRTRNARVRCRGPREPSPSHRRGTRGWRGWLGVGRDVQRARLRRSGGRDRDRRVCA